jgi:peptide/nickel transport system ATP-binding protein
MSAALSIENLRVEYPDGAGGVFVAVDGVSLDVAKGEIHALVGESGAGKTTVGNAAMGLIDKPGRIAGGTIRIGGIAVDPATGEAPGVVRGRDIGAVFQDPMTSLNPLFTVEAQIGETLRHHLGLDARAARERALELLRSVGIPEPERRLSAYPHQLSGGQRQRVVIACALSCAPKLVIADEPTTALDVSIQAQILKLLRDHADRTGIGLLLVTHNMGVVAEIADRVTIMHRGKAVESGKVRDVLAAPQHPYSRALLGAVPRLDRKLARFEVPGEGGGDTAQAARTKIAAQARDEGQVKVSEKLLEVRDLVVEYRARGWLPGMKGTAFRAVDGVSFDVAPGEIFGLVGESGCGKTTVAGAIAGLLKPDAGEILYRGVPVAAKGGASRRAIQMIFQDPYSSLNARLRIGTMLAEPILFYRLAATQAEATEDAAMLLNAVGLPPEAAQRFPHAFSGGQRQRISIARALAARPRLIVCDEPTSSLDVSVQAQILNLLKDLRDANGLTLLFISHDLAVVRQMCDRVAVMRGGKIVELRAADALFETPEHAYTRELLNLVPRPERHGRNGG